VFLDNEGPTDGKVSGSAGRNVLKDEGFKTEPFGEEMCGEYGNFILGALN
jgi:hypothetical protein